MGNTPKLRFEGYSGDWDRHTLGDVFTQTSNYVNPKEDGIALWSLTVEDGLTPKTERYVREFLVKKDDKFKEVRPGDIVYNPMNMTLGAVGYNGMDHSVAVSGYYTTMVAGEDYDSYFINTWLKSPQAILLYKTYATGTLLEKQRVQFPTLSIIPAVFPSMDEQTDIGTLFEGIDKLIALYQRKYELLTRAKQFYLQNMFPKNGEKKPRIRFTGFTDAWEQRKFGDVGSVAMCKRIFKEQTSEEGDVPFYKIGTFGGTPDAYISRELFEEYKKAYQYPSKGDILISASGSIGRTVEYTGEDEYFQDSNIVWLKHGDDIDNAFLKVLYSVVEWSCEGSTIKRLYNDNFLKTEFMLPYIEEQTKIGEFFSQIDNLITLHQRKCDELKTVKKFMLQNMFP